jgi:hypothetical protein
MTSFQKTNRICLYESVQGSVSKVCNRHHCSRCLSRSLIFKSAVSSMTALGDVALNPQALYHHVFTPISSRQGLRRLLERWRPISSRCRHQRAWCDLSFHCQRIHYIRSGPCIYLFGQVDESLLNVVDMKVFHVRPFQPPRTRGGKPTRLRISLAVRQAILSLSDQQIVTGSAILAAGFQGLRLGGIDSYHFQTVIYLAWMSSSVHLSALSILTPILKDRPVLRVWRLVGMLVLLVLLVIALIPTVSNDWGLITWKGINPPNSG